MTKALACLLVTGLILGQAAQAGIAKETKTWVMTAEGQKFVPFDPKETEGKGMALSVVFGDLQKKVPTAFLTKVPPGLVAGLHHHTNGYYAVVIKGKMRHFLKGNPEGEDIEAGGSWFQAPKEVHNDRCVGPEECMIYLYYPKYFDAFWEKNP